MTAAPDHGDPLAPRASADHPHHGAERGGQEPPLGQAQRYARLARCTARRLLPREDRPGPAQVPARHPDWDHSDSWNAVAAVDALRELVDTGVAELPVYDIGHSAVTGEHRVTAGRGDYILAEGLFAARLIGPLMAEALLAEALCVRQNRYVTAARRFARDLAERRKPPHTSCSEVSPCSGTSRTSWPRPRPRRAPDQSGARPRRLWAVPTAPGPDTAGWAREGHRDARRHELGVDGEYPRLANEMVRERASGLSSARVLPTPSTSPRSSGCRRPATGMLRGVPAGAAAGLEAGGAELLVLCTNTMHRVADRIEAATTIPFLHIGDVTAQAVRRPGSPRGPAGHGLHDGAVLPP